MTGRGATAAVLATLLTPGEPSLAPERPGRRLLLRPPFQRRGRLYCCRQRGPPLAPLKGPQTTLYGQQPKAERWSKKCPHVVVVEALLLDALKDEQLQHLHLLMALLHLSHSPTARLQSSASDGDLQLENKKLTIKFEGQ
ncbi:hypothetical protein R5R35_007813 [Gryllus longicercus]|uniref:Uncharacterized protein n=1 Tax=Gryllus longicercus TaxID=2509291 RepID=A0AAN9W1L1_9ORTH